MGNLQSFLTTQEADANAESYYQAREASRSFQAQRRLVLRCCPGPYERILEVGCGAGNMLRYLVSRSSCVVGCDLSPKRVRIAGTSLPPGSGCVLSADTMFLPFADHKFDAVVAMGVAEFIESPEVWLKELRRMLQNDGILIVSFPHGNCAARQIGRVLRQYVPRLYRRPDKPQTPGRVYRSALDFERLLVANGFEVIFRAYCGLRVVPWPFHRFRLLRSATEYLEPIRCLSGRRSLSSVSVLAARLFRCEAVTL